MSLQAKLAQFSGPILNPRHQARRSNPMERPRKRAPPTFERPLEPPPLPRPESDDDLVPSDPNEFTISGPRLASLLKRHSSKKCRLWYVRFETGDRPCNMVFMTTPTPEHLFVLVSEGGFEIQFSIPQQGGTVAKSEGGFWRQAEHNRAPCRRSVARFIVAFTRVMQELYPDITSVTHENEAIVDVSSSENDYEEFISKHSPSLGVDGANQLFVDRILYRHFLYEKLGFTFVCGKTVREMSNKLASRLLQARSQGNLAAVFDQEFMQVTDDHGIAWIGDCYEFTGDLLAIGRRLQAEDPSVRVRSLEHMECLDPDAAYPAGVKVIRPIRAMLRLPPRPVMKIEEVD
jgi:hypothetical protein